MGKRKGVLNRDPHRPRAYRVRTAWSADFPEAPTHVPSDRRTSPLVGRIAAGTPIVAEEAVEDILTLPRSLVGEGQLFALKVVGDSMVDAAICEGDIVTVRRQGSADHGDIVVALLDGEATVKRLRREDGWVWLMPHNSAYEPIPGDDAASLEKSSPFCETSERKLRRAARPVDVRRAPRRAPPSTLPSTHLPVRPTGRYLSRTRPPKAAVSC